MNFRFPGTRADRAAAVRETAARWLARVESGEFSAADRAQFEAWLDADDTHQREYDAMRAMWNRLEGLRASAVVARERESQRGRFLSWQCTTGWAAGSVVAALLAAVLLLFRGGDMTLETDIGEQKRVTLADGTVVHANTDTLLNVHYTDEARRLELVRGEVYVVVAADPKRPLEMYAGGATIRDVGTRFSVRQQDAQVSVAVTDGAIEVSLPATGGESRQVQAGESLTYSPLALGDPRSSDVAAAVAWTEGRLVFEQAPLADVFKTLNRYRRLAVVVTAPELAAYRVSGVFRVDDTDGALWGIQQLVSVRYEPRGDQLLALPANPTEPLTPPVLRSSPLAGLVNK